MSLKYDNFIFYWAVFTEKKRLNSVHAKVSSFTLEFLKINLLLLRPWKYLKSKTNTNE